MDGIELRELRYFIAVAEDLNFTRAAARLGMTQPPLSAAIAKLERKLGVTLLTRTPRLTVAIKPGIGADLLKRIMRLCTSDPRGLDTELLLTEPRVAVLPATHPLAAHPGLRRADLASEPMPHGPREPLPRPSLRPGRRPVPERGRGGRNLQPFGPNGLTSPHQETSLYREAS